nr:MAG TPA: hypothetical protein [Caudoviricetes sp.]
MTARVFPSQHDYYSTLGGGTQVENVLMIVMI